MAIVLPLALGEAVALPHLMYSDEDVFPREEVGGRGSQTGRFVAVYKSVLRVLQVVLGRGGFYVGSTGLALGDGNWPGSMGAGQVLGALGSECDLCPLRSSQGDTEFLTFEPGDVGLWAWWEAHLAEEFGSQGVRRSHS